MQSKLLLTTSSRDSSLPMVASSEIREHVKTYITFPEATTWQTFTIIYPRHMLNEALGGSDAFLTLSIGHRNVYVPVRCNENFGTGPKMEQGSNFILQNLAWSRK